MLGNLRQSSVLDSSNLFQSLSVEVGFWIPIVSAVPDSLSCSSDSRFQIGPKFSVITSPYVKNLAQPHACLSMLSLCFHL